MCIICMRSMIAVTSVPSKIGVTEVIALCTSRSRGCACWPSVNCQLVISDSKHRYPLLIWQHHFAGSLPPTSVSTGARCAQVMPFFWTSVEAVAQLKCAPALSCVGRHAVLYKAVGSWQGPCFLAQQQQEHCWDDEWEMGTARGHRGRGKAHSSAILRMSAAYGM